MKHNYTHTDKLQEEKSYLMASNMSSLLFYTQNQVDDIYAYVKHRYARADKFQREK